MKNTTSLTHWGRDKMITFLKLIFMNEMYHTLIRISLKSVSEVSINDKKSLVEVMPWHRIYFFWGLLGNACHMICFILIDHLYSRHFWQSTIKHNSIKCIKHVIKRYDVHNKSGNGIYVHNINQKYWNIFCSGVYHSRRDTMEDEFPAWL